VLFIVFANKNNGFCLGKFLRENNRIVPFENLIYGIITLKYLEKIKIIRGVAVATPLKG